MVHLTYRETEKGHGMAEFSSGSVLFAPYDDARTRASGTSSDLYYSSNSDLSTFTHHDLPSWSNVTTWIYRYV